MEDSEEGLNLVGCMVAGLADDLAVGGLERPGDGEVDRILGWL